jgi:hypothetical protein
MAARKVTSNNFELGEPVGPRGLRTICTDSDDGARNWFVTLAYRDLSRLTAAYTHGEDMTAPPASVSVAAASGRRANPTPQDVFEVRLHAALKSGEGLVAELGRNDGATMKVELMASSPASVKSSARSPADEFAALAGFTKAVAHRAPAAASPSPARPLNANFCTFAMWSSLTIGRDIRNKKLPRRFERLNGMALRHTATNFVIDARRTHHMELSKVLGLGQRRILWDVGRGLYSMFIADEQGAFAKAAALQDLTFDNFDHPPDFTDTATNELADMIEGWLPEPAHPRRHNGLTQLRSRDLALGLASYHLARVAAQRNGETDAGRKWVAQLILRGNLLIAAYEQHRVDQLLKYPVDDFASDFFLERSGVEAVEVNGGGRWRQRVANRARRELLHLPEIWGRFFTDQIMVLWAGDELLRLGRDLPIPPGAATFLPDELDDIEDAWLATLLRRYDHSYGNGHGTQSRIWSVFDDRMNYIVNFMRSRAQSPGLWQEPFDPSEIDDLRHHIVPKGKHDRSA